MERKIEKIKGAIREELGSIKMMILSITMSFGLVLSIASFIISMFSMMESANVIKEFVKSPYDAETNEMLATTIDIAFVFQIVTFLISFIPLILMTIGIYLIYLNAKNNNIKTTGLKITGGVFKYHAIISYIGAAFMVLIGVLLVVAAFVFDSEISEFGEDPTGEFALAVKIMAVVFLVIFVIMAMLYIGLGVVYMSLRGNMKYIVDIVEKGYLIKKMSIIGAIVLIIAGLNSVMNIFSGVTSIGLTTEDIEMLEEMLGGQMTKMVVDMMPSKIVQFETIAVQCAYSFFSGASLVLGGIILASIRSKINKVLEEQEVVEYGGDNFISGN